MAAAWQHVHCRHVQRPVGKCLLPFAADKTKEPRMFSQLPRDDPYCRRHYRRCGLQGFNSIHRSPFLVPQRDAEDRVIGFPCALSSSRMTAGAADTCQPPVTSRWSNKSSARPPIVYIVTTAQDGTAPKTPWRGVFSPTPGQTAGGDEPLAPQKGRFALGIGEGMLRGD